MPNPVSRVGEDITKASLDQKGMGVALLTAGVEGEHCRQSGLVLGVREKDGFRVYKGVVLRRTEAPIAEVKLRSGEYHVLGFSCDNRGHTAHLSELGYDGHRRVVYTRSHASFTVQTGDIVNVGFLKVGRIGQSPIAIDVDLAVVNWPPADRERFKEQRPGLHAQMKTRLMLLTPPLPAGVQCAEMRKRLAERWTRSLPPECQPGARPKAIGKAGRGGAA